MSLPPAPPSVLSTTESEDSSALPIEQASFRDSRGARILVLLLFAAIVATRIFFILHYRIDSDEPQHLHVVWGWTHHLVQYRDVFDNHTPLFHLASIPLFRLVGERADALLFMRFAMAPLFFFSLWCVYRLGVTIRSAEVGLWGAVLAALSPAFCFTFTEYRTDDLWTAFWLLSLVVLLGGPPTWKRGFIVGLLFGAAVATSLKTLALLGCLGAAAIAGCAIAGNLRTTFTKKSTYVFLASILAGSAILPAVLALWFASQHALNDALFGIFTYNSVPGLGRIRILRDFIIGLLELIGTIALLVPSSAWMARTLIAPENRFRFHLIFLGSGFYGALIYTLWPLLDAEHLIPFHPLIVLGVMPLVLHGVSRIIPPSRVTTRCAVLAAAAAVLITAETRALRPVDLRRSLHHYAELLRLSDPDDYVMDLKGETIFRRRPYRFLFEGVGVIRAKKGLMPDDVPEQMIKTRTCITLRHNWRFIFPRAIAFMDENYISVGAYRVVGHAMTPATDRPGFTFQIPFPETFVFLADGHSVPGKIDGQPCSGSASLGAGPHEFLPDAPETQVDFVWKKAADRGFFPEHRAAETTPRPPKKSRKQS